MTSVKLTIPNDLVYLSPVLAFIREIAQKTGFNAMEANKIELALEEAITNILRHSLPRDETVCFDLEVQPLPIGMELSLHDMGRPFDEQATRQYHPDLSSQEDRARGLGSYLIRSLMDVVEYHSLGNKGKTLRLVKYFHHPPVSYDVTKSILWNPSEEPAQAAPGQNFTIRRFVPGDALALSELAYDTYGYTYFYESLYFPDRLITLNETDNIISVVAVTEDNRLAGHAGLFCNPALPSIAEIAMGMVNPGYRGYHLLDRITEKCLVIASERGMNGIFTQAVTQHALSQPAAKKIGSLPIGFLPGYLPSANFKGMENPAKDRITLAVGFKPLHSYHTGILYFPSRRKEIIERLLSGISIQWEQGESVNSGKTESVFTIQVNRNCSFSRMIVYETGHDIILGLKQFLFRLRQEGLLIGELLLNLNDPLSPLHYDEIEALGFIFTGILPGSVRGNFITLVYLNGINPNFNSIHLIADYGQDLLNYIQQDYERRFLQV